MLQQGRAWYSMMLNSMIHYDTLLNSVVRYDMHSYDMVQAGHSKVDCDTL